MEIFRTCIYSQPGIFLRNGVSFATNQVVAYHIIVLVACRAFFTQNSTSIASPQGLVHYIRKVELTLHYIRKVKLPLHYIRKVELTLHYMRKVELPLHYIRKVELTLHYIMKVELILHSITKVELALHYLNFLSV